MTSSSGQMNPLVVTFCNTVIRWLKGELDISRKKLIQSLYNIACSPGYTTLIPAQINQELTDKHQVAIRLNYAVTEKGKELRIDHIEDFVRDLQQLKKRMIKSTESRQERIESEEKRCRIKAT